MLESCDNRRREEERCPHGVPSARRLPVLHVAPTLACLFNHGEMRYRKKTYRNASAECGLADSEYARHEISSLVEREGQDEELCAAIILFCVLFPQGQWH